RGADAGHLHIAAVGRPADQEAHVVRRAGGSAPGGKETEISEVDVHLRLGQAGHCEAEIEAAAIVGVTLEEDLEPLASELVAQGRKECHRGEVAVAYAPGGLRDLALRPDRLHPAILPGADRQGM